MCLMMKGMIVSLLNKGQPEWVMTQEDDSVIYTAEIKGQTYKIIVDYVDSMLDTVVAYKGTRFIGNFSSIDEALNNIWWSVKLSGTTAKGRKDSLYKRGNGFLFRF